MPLSLTHFHPDPVLDKSRGARIAVLSVNILFYFPVVLAAVVIPPCRSPQSHGDTFCLGSGIMNEHPRSVNRTMLHHPHPTKAQKSSKSVSWLPEHERRPAFSAHGALVGHQLPSGADRWAARNLLSGRGPYPFQGRSYQRTGEHPPHGVRWKKLESSPAELGRKKVLALVPFPSFFGRGERGPANNLASMQLAKTLQPSESHFFCLFLLIAGPAQPGNQLDWTPFIFHNQQSAFLRMLMSNICPCCT